MAGVLLNLLSLKQRHLKQGSAAGFINKLQVLQGADEGSGVQGGLMITGLSQGLGTSKAALFFCVTLRCHLP